MIIKINLFSIPTIFIYNCVAIWLLFAWVAVIIFCLCILNIRFVVIAAFYHQFSCHHFIHSFFLRGKSMTAATFSADGSVLAVAAETVITLWDPDENCLVAVVGETYTVIIIFFIVPHLWLSTAHNIEFCECHYTYATLYFY